MLNLWSEFGGGKGLGADYPELKEEFRPIASDEETLRVISEVSENIGKMVTAYQTEVLENHHHQEIQEEEKAYTKVRQGIFIQVKSIEFFCQLV